MHHNYRPQQGGITDAILHYFLAGLAFQLEEQQKMAY
jgi:hypothetical protein